MPGHSCDGPIALKTAKWIKEYIFQLEFPSLLFHISSIVTVTLKIGDSNYGQRPLKQNNVATMMEQAFNARFQTGRQCRSLMIISLPVMS